MVNKRSKIISRMVTDKLHYLGIPYKTEVRVCSERKWRFDVSVTDYIAGKDIAIEYEGIIASKSRHTSVTGYTGDCSKYNQAAINGVVVLRYTALNIHELLNDLDKLAAKYGTKK